MSTKTMDDISTHIATPVTGLQTVQNQLKISTPNRVYKHMQSNQGLKNLQVVGIHASKKLLLS